MPSRKKPALLARGNRAHTGRQHRASPCALGFVALDKLYHQARKKVIVAVPERSIRLGQDQGLPEPQEPRAGAASR
jgi:hypothetical protein